LFGALSAIICFNNEGVQDNSPVCLQQYCSHALPLRVTVRILWSCAGVLHADLSFFNLYETLLTLTSPEGWCEPLLRAAGSVIPLPRVPFPSRGFSSSLISGQDPGY
jgi:hypothetical protein